MICSVPFASGLLSAVHLQCQHSCVFQSSTRFCIYKLNVATLWISAGTGRPRKCQATIRCQDLDSSCPSIGNRCTRFDSAGLTQQVWRSERMSTRFHPVAYVLAKLYAARSSNELAAC